MFKIIFDDYDDSISFSIRTVVSDDFIVRDSHFGLGVFRKGKNGKFM